MSRNVHIQEFDLVRLPIQIQAEDRGYSTCGEPRLALASVSDCGCQWKNDVYGIALIADSITIELEKDGVLEPALGYVPTFPLQPNAVGFVIDWRQNLIAYGAGCYKIKVNYDISGIEGYYYDSQYQLYPYSVEASEETVQLFVQYDDMVRRDGINYTGSGFFTSLRFLGFFGNEKINSEHNILLKANNIREKIRNFAAPSYDLVTRPLTRCLTRPLKQMLLNACNIWISDFNKWNHEDYRYFNVILSDAEGIDFEGDEQFKRTIHAVLIDKTWTTESKFSDRVASPPNISEIIQCSGGEVVCPTLCEQISDVVWTTIKACMSVGQIEAATEDLCDCPPPVCDPVTIQLRDSADNNIGIPDVYPAGTTANKTAPDGVVNLLRSTGGFMRSVNVRSNQSLDETIANTTVQLIDSANNNIGAVNSYLAESSNNLTAPDGVVTVNRDGVFFATQAVLSNGTATVNVPSDCPASSPQGGRLPFKTGQTTVYETGDDGTTQRGQEFFTLPFTNPFGNTTRFLDTLGGTAYADDIVLDLSTTQWLTATTGTFMGYVFENVTGNFNTQVANALAATHGGYSGWSIFNDRELMSLSVDDGSVNNSLNHSGLLVPNTFMLHTGKTNPNSTGLNIQRSTGGVILSANKGNNGRRIDARLFNFSVSGGVVTLS